MPWHLSRSNPTKVYDSHHHEACIAASPELAAFIVRAANAAIMAGATVPIRLRESSLPERKESAEVGSERAASGTAQAGKPLDTFETDECCTKHLAKALRSGILKADEWLCPVCGCEWKAEMRGPLRHWIPVTMIALLRI